MPIPYVINTGSLEKFFKHIQTAKTPTTLDDKFLQSGGFGATNEKYLKAFMKNIGFTDKSGAPTQRWRDHRHDAHARRLRAEGVREAYAGFFDAYADAQRRSSIDFENWARAEDPSASPTTVSRASRTFEAMVKLADFDGLPSDGAGGSVGSQGSNPGGAHGSGGGTPPPPPPPSGTTFGTGGININIELQLPPTADAAFFDAFFASMRKHLKDG